MLRVCVRLWCLLVVVFYIAITTLDNDDHDENDDGDACNDNDLILQLCSEYASACGTYTGRGVLQRDYNTIQ